MFDAIGGYSERMRFHFEDWELNARFCLEDYRGEVVIAETQQYRVRPSSRTTENREKTRNSRQDLLISLAEYTWPKAAARERKTLLVAAIYASLLVRNNLISAGVGQDAYWSGDQNLIRALRHSIKSVKQPQWRKRLSIWLVSVVKHLNGFRT